MKFNDLEKHHDYVKGFKDDLDKLCIKYNITDEEQINDIINLTYHSFYGGVCFMKNKFLEGFNDNKKEIKETKSLILESIYEELNCRFALGKKGDKTLIFFGVNPSTATPGNYDQTMKKIKNLTLVKNYNSWIMFNLYPQRTTNPDYLDIKCNEIIHKENLKIINKLIPSNSTVVAAWGDLITKRTYLTNCLKDIVKELENKEITWKHIGDLTKEGNPRHPLFLKNKEVMNDFNIIDYLKQK